MPAFRAAAYVSAASAVVAAMFAIMLIRTADLNPHHR